MGPSTGYTSLQSRGMCVITCVPVLGPIRRCMAKDNQKPREGDGDWLTVWAYVIEILQGLKTRSPLAQNAPTVIAHIVLHTLYKKRGRVSHRNTLRIYFLIRCMVEIKGK